MLAKQQGGRIPVRVMNPRAERRHIRKGEHLASFQEVEVLTKMEQEEHIHARKAGESQTIQELMEGWTPELRTLYENIIEKLSE